MDRSVLLVMAVCLLPALVSAARPAKNPFVVQGRVYCDNCRAGFETSKTTYISGAKVRVECKDRKNMGVVYKKEGTTDRTGTYNIFVHEDHEDQLCDAILVGSPQLNCRSPSAGRERTRVILTRYNGINSDNRYANNMGFMRDEPMSGCTELLRQYLEYED